MSQRIDRTGQSYGQLIASYDTGKSTKRGERVWAAECRNPIADSICGRVIETYKLGQTDGPTRCPECSKAMFCQPRDITGQVFSGWKAIKRIKRYSGKRDIWLFRCLTCGRRVRRNAANIESIAPCRKCKPLPRATPLTHPQKPTTKEYPLLTIQIEALRAKLAPELSAGKLMEVVVGGKYSAFVDARDASKVLPHYWRISADPNGQTFYVMTKIEGHSVQMHRLILGMTDPEKIVDHKDHYGINNTRENIRIATGSQSGANRRKPFKPTSSRYKGVNWTGKNSKNRPWQATIHDKVDGKRRTVFLGYFANEADAARAYNAAAIERFGEFACLNDVPPPDALRGSRLRQNVRNNNALCKWESAPGTKRVHLPRLDLILLGRLPSIGSRIEYTECPL